MPSYVFHADLVKLVHKQQKETLFSLFCVSCLGLVKYEQKISNNINAFIRTSWFCLSLFHCLI